MQLCVFHMQSSPDSGRRKRRPVHLAMPDYCAPGCSVECPATSLPVWRGCADCDCACWLHVVAADPVACDGAARPGEPGIRHYMLCRQVTLLVTAPGRAPMGVHVQQQPLLHTCHLCATLVFLQTVCRRTAVSAHVATHAPTHRAFGDVERAEGLSGRAT